MNMMIFNGVVQRLQYCVSGAGPKLKVRLNLLAEWLHSRVTAAGEPYLAHCDRLLSHSFEVRARLLFCSYRFRFTLLLQ